MVETGNNSEGSSDEAADNLAASGIRNPFVAYTPNPFKEKNSAPDEENREIPIQDEKEDDLDVPSFLRGNLNDDISLD